MAATGTANPSKEVDDTDGKEERGDTDTGDEAQTDRSTNTEGGEMAGKLKQRDTL